MRYSPQQLARTRQRILASAARLFAERGYAGTSIAAVMADCGLTAGGFYRHFRSKSALYAEACPPQPAAPLPSARAAAAAADTLEPHLRGWLGHRQLAALAADAASAHPDVRRAASARFSSWAAGIQRDIEAQTGSTDSLALAATALVVGTVAMAQASRDAAAQQRWLAACEHGTRVLLRPGETYFWALH